MKANKLNRNCNIFNGSGSPKPIGTYVPVSKMSKLDDPGTINARYYDRKGNRFVKNSDV